LSGKVRENEFCKVVGTLSEIVSLRHLSGTSQVDFAGATDHEK